MDNLYLANLYKINTKSYTNVISVPFRNTEDITPEVIIWDPESRSNIENCFENNTDFIFWDFIDNEDPKKFIKNFPELEWERIIMYLFKKFEEKNDEVRQTYIKTKSGISAFFNGPMSPRYSNKKRISQKEVNLIIYSGKDKYDAYISSGQKDSNDKNIVCSKLRKILEHYKEIKDGDYRNIEEGSKIKEIILNLCENDDSA